ncbi:adhesin biosynthesis transcription regulatory family protein [Shewanella psychrotolerans]|uniref:adhesin biosynthesis transcription regulatory family protein n=1 Tax=Shewanella psychrotolerans TaxID=2864206 RepID=UPI001C6595E1|nr:adhesin biosynthesis transcription regulatory family protein [Shewanella psychrotolerans]QYK02429.1 adhesin biosynthesis transcription regulatory family protein [Shewanella psychrotolerans]
MKKPKPLPVLVQGHENRESMAVLLKLTRITSPNKVDAIMAHLVDGLPAKRAYWRYQVDQRKFSQALAKLNQVADLALQYQTTKATN